LQRGVHEFDRVTKHFVARFSPAVARAVHRDCFLCPTSVFFSCAPLRRRSSCTIPLRAATSLSSAHDRFNLSDESFEKHRSLLTCGRALAAAWRPRWRRWRSSRPVGNEQPALAVNRY